MTHQELKETVMKSKFLSFVAAMVVVIGGCVGSATAEGRHKVTLEASVPFEFVLGNRAFPAGTYIFEMATGTPKPSDQAGVLVVRSHERKLYAAVAADVAADAKIHEGHKLEFVRAGDRVFLSKVWRQGGLAGLTVHTAPGATEAEETQASEVLTLDAQQISGGV
jgi:hypothetical protein